MKPKYTVLIVNSQELSLLRWITKDAAMRYPLTYRQSVTVLPSLKKKLSKRATTISLPSIITHET